MFVSGVWSIVFLSPPSYREQQLDPKARSQREEAEARGARQRPRSVSEGVEARGARRSGAGHSRVGIPRRQADRDGDEAYFGDARRNVIRRREDERVDDRAVADGA